MPRPKRMQLASRTLPVSRVEAVGSYTLVVLQNDGGDTGVPGQFFMLRAQPEPSAAYLPRALSAAWADDGEIAFLMDVRGAGTTSLVTASEVTVTGPLGHGFPPADGPAILVGGGIGAAILPWLVRTLPGPVTTVLGFRQESQAVCAALVDPDATVVLEPTYVTEPLARLLPAEANVYACGPDPMLKAVAALCAEHGSRCLLAMEAAMACGFGACYGCAVELDGAWKRLCIEGPVVEAERILAGRAGG
jgi:dihydroorotate dehydrogenase electron transfer subunit